MRRTLISGSIRFRRRASKSAAKIRPTLHDLRLHAERAITLLAEARDAAHAANTANSPIPKRSTRSNWARAASISWASNSRTPMRSWRSTTRRRRLPGTRAAGTRSATSSKPSARHNGRIQDIRDGYALLGGLYRQAWLRVNRPYWLENNLARYDKAAQLWIDRGDKWGLVKSSGLRSTRCRRWPTRGCRRARSEV